MVKVPTSKEPPSLTGAVRGIRSHIGTQITKIPYGGWPPQSSAAVPTKHAIVTNGTINTIIIYIFHDTRVKREELIAVCDAVLPGARLAGPACRVSSIMVGRSMDVPCMLNVKSLINANAREMLVVRLSTTR